MIAPSAAPTPMPALAPPLKPDDKTGAGDGDASEAPAGVEVGAVVVEVFEETEIEVVRRSGVTRLDNSRVAVLADERIVATGVPAESSRNLPTPVSQQSLV